MTGSRTRDPITKDSVMSDRYHYDPTQVTRADLSRVGVVCIAFLASGLQLWRGLIFAALELLGDPLDWVSYGLAQRFGLSSLACLMAMVIMALIIRLDSRARRRVHDAQGSKESRS